MLILYNSFAVFSIRIFFFYTCNSLILPTDALKIPLRISVGEIQQGNYGSDDLECENTICALNIRKQTSWDDFSKAVSQALTNHFQAISSDGWWSLEDVTFNNTTDSSIGLGASSVRSITLGISSPAMKRKLNFWGYVYGLYNLRLSSLIKHIQSSRVAAAGSEKLAYSQCSHCIMLPFSIKMLLCLR